MKEALESGGGEIIMAVNMEEKCFNSGCGYDDIINLPHPVSKVHPPMPAANRAAQFSPFAALTGYEEAVEETARLTDERLELEEDAVCALDEKLRILQERIAEQPEASVTYFRPDARKAGGAYVTVSGRIKKIDCYEQMLVMKDGQRIPIRDVMAIEYEYNEVMELK